MISIVVKFILDNLPLKNGISMFSIPGFEIKEQIYQSNHSLVFRGNLKDSLPVILKMLNYDYPPPEEVARFKGEYEMTRSLGSEGIIKVYELKRHKNTWVIIEEDFGGDSLAQLLSSQILDIIQFLKLAIRITEILRLLHQRNIMHKDINPSNIVWNMESAPKAPIQLKIIDLGISTKLSREQPEILSPNILEGTLSYMSPEQTGRMNRAMDYRTDLYSLGATFYRMLTRRQPFDTEDAMELVHCHIAKLPKAPHEVDSNIPRVLSDILLKLMAKAPEDRYQSALGLQADLQQCLDRFQLKRSIDSFELGQHDISDHFQIPQKLYGREHEVETLMNAFSRVAEGGIEMMLVAGYSGVGKSALIHEIHKPIVVKRGYFISGKFGQFERNIPYSAIIQAFQELIKHLFTEPEERLVLWKEKLMFALEPNGQVIVDVIPEVKTIMGPQPPVPELGPQETQNRFNLTFRKFIEVFSQEDHPLVIFLDDLQWADSAIPFPIVEGGSVLFSFLEISNHSSTIEHSSL